LKFYATLTSALIYKIRQTNSFAYSPCTC